MKALIVVDVQEDFCEGGSLAVEGGRAVARAISAYVSETQDGPSPYDLIVLTRDWHTPGENNGGHFSENPDYVDTWPAHCVAWTDGAQLAEELWVSVPYVDVRKGQHKPAYSGFDGFIVGESVSLSELLAFHGVGRIDVCGLALDYCVKATALDARSLFPGAVVSVITDLTSCVYASGEPTVCRELDAAGVELELAFMGDLC